MREQRLECVSGTCRNGHRWLHNSSISNFTCGRPGSSGMECGSCWPVHFDFLFECASSAGHRMSERNKSRLHLETSSMQPRSQDADVLGDCGPDQCCSNGVVHCQQHKPACHRWRAPVRFDAYRSVWQPFVGFCCGLAAVDSSGVSGYRNLWAGSTCSGRFAHDLPDPSAVLDILFTYPDSCFTRPTLNHCYLVCNFIPGAIGAV
mmetsp:Transcript_27579/g.72896  ORF Transcript_27579/g.72896 Transcript_27579/m.72896 type:complete len:205 (+) Transcript_27579:85-699(+)